MSESSAPKRPANDDPEVSVSPNKKAKKTGNQPNLLKKGDTIPNIQLVNQDNKEVFLLDLVKDNGAIFFIYPRANTPGCTKQACGFRDHHEMFTKAGYQIYGLSADSPKAQTNWKNKHNLPYDFLCDPERKALNAFGCIKLGKVIRRSHIIIGKGGVIEDLQIQVSPIDSINKALEYVA